jgi:hypothetical protein
MTESRGGQVPPLSKWHKVAYGAGDSGFSLTSTALALLYLFFLVNVVGLDPAAAALSVVWSDPIWHRLHLDVARAADG